MSVGSDGVGVWRVAGEYGKVDVVWKGVTVGGVCGVWFLVARCVEGRRWCAARSVLGG